MRTFVALFNNAIYLVPAWTQDGAASNFGGGARTVGVLEIGLGVETIQGPFEVNWAKGITQWSG